MAFAYLCNCKPCIMRVRIEYSQGFMQGFIKALLLMLFLHCLTFRMLNIMGACCVDVALSSNCDRLQLVSLRSFVSAL